jgi:hypothetical protein
MSYTTEEINEFQQKDKRISWLSIFSSLCASHNGGNTLSSVGIKAMADIAYELNEQLVKTYPMKTISQTIKNRAQGEPF